MNKVIQKQLEDAYLINQAILQKKINHTDQSN